jgi:hypothetical protein
MEIAGFSAKLHGWFEQGLRFVDSNDAFIVSHRSGASAKARPRRLRRQDEHTAIPEIHAGLYVGFSAVFLFGLFAKRQNDSPSASI